MTPAERFPQLATLSPGFDVSELPADIPQGFEAVQPNNPDEARFELPGVVLEIARLDPAARSMGSDWPRFNVLRTPTVRELEKWGEGAEDEGVTGGDDWAEIRAAIMRLLGRGTLFSETVSPGRPDDVFRVWDNGSRHAPRYTLTGPDGAVIDTFRDPYDAEREASFLLTETELKDAQQ